VPYIASFDGVDDTTVDNDWVGKASCPAPESRHSMNSISVIGVGKMAGALAGRALAGGNAVEIIGRDRVKAEELAATLDGATVGADDAAPTGDIVVLAVPYGSAAAVVSRYGDALRGKVIIDITNPVNADFTGFVTPEGSSGAQEIAKAAPAGAHVVKAFNTLFANVLAAGTADGRPLDVFIAGDDTQAKARVSAFIESLGLRPMDAGQLPMARALENAALLQLGLVANSVRHTNFALGVSVLG
jgi:8-hydroxy-5-deazaflavin:NADPH oxidoreductase